MNLCRSNFLILLKINRMFYNDSIFLYDIDDNRLVNNTIHTWINTEIVTNDTILKNWTIENILKEYFKNV